MAKAKKNGRRRSSSCGRVAAYPAMMRQEQLAVVAAELGMTKVRRREILMVNSIWPEGNGSRSPLPPPNVVVARSRTPTDELTPEAVKGILVNPIYTGVGPFPRLVDDEAWVRACAKLIEDEGTEQFLVKLLYVLRESLAESTDLE